MSISVDEVVRIYDILKSLLGTIAPKCLPYLYEFGTFAVLERSIFTVDSLPITNRRTSLIGLAFRGDETYIIYRHFIALVRIQPDASKDALKLKIWYQAPPMTYHLAVDLLIDSERRCLQLPDRLVIFLSSSKKILPLPWDSHQASLVLLSTTRKLLLCGQVGSMICIIDNKGQITRKERWSPSTQYTSRYRLLQAGSGEICLVVPQTPFFQENTMGYVLIYNDQLVLQKRFRVACWEYAALIKENLYLATHNGAKIFVYHLSSGILLRILDLGYPVVGLNSHKGSLFVVRRMKVDTLQITEY